MKSLRFLWLSFSLALLAPGLVRAADFHRSIIGGVEGDLIKRGGVSVSAEAITEKKYLFIYFSAHWCGPCRVFTPDLVRFYEQHAGKGQFELLFISSDRSQAALEKYMDWGKMPWVALKLSSPRVEEGKEKFGVAGIPCLVLLDEHDQVLASSFSGEEYLGPKVAIEKYLSLKP